MKTTRAGKRRHRGSNLEQSSSPVSARSKRALDDLDWQIIELLRENGRHQNKELAKLLRVSEPTVASRIKRLRADGVMLVTVQEDIYNQGFDFQCIAQIAVDERDVEVTSRDLAMLPNVTVVTLLLGTPEILIVFNARNRAHMIEVVNQEIARIKGIQSIEADVALKIAKYESSFANLARPFVEDNTAHTPALNDLNLRVDELDRAIIAALQPDGRLSNREIARQLEVSEATVRQRLKRLQNDNAIRVGVVVDAVRTGFRTSAWVRVSITPRFLNQAIVALCQIPEVTYVGETTGTYNVLLVMFGRTEISLLRLVNSRIRSLSGVARFEVRVIAETVKHNYFEVAISNGRFT